MVQLNDFRELVRSMYKQKKSIEQFYVSYNSIKFDIIIDIGTTPFELMIGAVGHNWAATLIMYPGFYVQMSDNDYYALRSLLSLEPSNSPFTSNKFLMYIASHAPKSCNAKLVHPSHLLPFRKTKLTEECDKTVFSHWLQHTSDGRNVRPENLEKTKLLLGQKCFEFCKKNNISSCWISDNSKSCSNIIEPWDLYG